MMKTVTIKISQVIGSGYGVSASDGKLVYNAIANEISKGNRVLISFENTTRLTTAFLNAAVGQLYGEFSADKVRSVLVPPEDAEDWQLHRLKLVIDRAKVFFSDPDSVSGIISSEVGGDDDS